VNDRRQLLGNEQALLKNRSALVEDSAGRTFSDFHREAVIQDTGKPSISNSGKRQDNIRPSCNSHFITNSRRPVLQGRLDHRTQAVGGGPRLSEKNTGCCSMSPLSGSSILKRLLFSK
jgi:hypothetical protein